MRPVALVAGAVALALLVLVWTLRPKRPADDAQMIRDAIADMTQKAVDKDLGGILEHVSDHYNGEGGSKDELRSTLQAYIIVSKIVTAFATNVDVKVEGGKARTSFVLVLGRTPAKTAAELRGDSLVGSHAIEATFTREGSVWRVLGASRKDASPGDFIR